MANIWIILIFAIPTVLTILLKVNAVYVYLALCLGYVLTLFDGGSKVFNKVAGSTKVIESIGGTNDIRIILLLLPAAIVLLFMLHTTSGGKYSLNLLPSIAVGLLAVITVVPLLPLTTAVKVMEGSLWKDITKYEGTIVAACSLVVVVLFILSRSKMSGSSKNFKHNKSKA